MKGHTLSRSFAGLRYTGSNLLDHYNEGGRALALEAQAPKHQYLSRPELPLPHSTWERRKQRISHAPKM